MRANTNAKSPWLPFEDRRRAREAKREAVIRTAAQLFLEQGYHRATLDDVAERLHITKPALYNYFRSKEEILAECFSYGQGLIGCRIMEISAEPGTGLDKLRKLSLAFAEIMTTDFGMCLMRVDDRELSAANRKLVQRGKKKITMRFAPLSRKASPMDPYYRAIRNLRRLRS